MNTTTWAVGTSAVVVAGRWATDKPLDIKLVIGLGVYAVSLSLLSNMDAELAAKFSGLVFFAACLGPEGLKGGTPTIVAIFQKLGLGGK
jgi:phenolic acid decarboxylase